jgi:hypothetical protein
MVWVIGVSPVPVILLVCLFGIGDLWFDDHLINFIEIPILVYDPTAENKPSPNFNPESINRFKQSLSNVSWNDVYQTNDINKSVKRFWATFLQVIVYGICRQFFLSAAGGRGDQF